MQEDKSFYRYKDYFEKASDDFTAAENLLNEENLESACCR